MDYSWIKCGSQFASSVDAKLDPGIKSGIKEGIMGTWLEIKHLWRHDGDGVGDEALMAADHARFTVCDGGFSSAHEEATVFRHG